MESTWGSSCIEDGTLSLVNEQECRDAARELNKKYQNTVNRAFYPSGCFFGNRGATYWNLHKTGKKHSSRGAICKTSGRKFLYHFR